MRSSDAFQGKFAADFLWNQFNARKVAVVFVQNDYGVGLKDAFVTEWESLGGELLLAEGVAQDATDIRASLLKVQAAEPDAVFFPAYRAVGVVGLKQMKELGLNVALYTGDAFIPDVITAAGDAAEGVYFTNISVEGNAVTQRLLEAYREKFGKEPDALPMVAFGYDAVFAIKQAAENSNSTTPTGIAQGLYSVDFTGAGGEIQINEQGLAKRVEKIYQIRNGLEVLVE